MEQRSEQKRRLIRCVSALVIASMVALCAECPAGFTALRAAVENNPEVGFQCVERLPAAAQRDFILRRAFTLAATRPEFAAQYLNRVVDQPWAADAGFLPSLAIARASNANAARKLMLAAARQNPSMGLRERDSYLALPYGREIFDEAVHSASGETVGLAARMPTLQAALRASDDPALKVLSELAIHPSLDPIRRERVAVFYRQIAAGTLSVAEAAKASDDDAFFPAVLKLRLAVTGRDAQVLDRVLERHAQMLFRWFEDRNPSLARLSATELYLLLAYGRAEEDDRLFNGIFDHLLLPKLRGGARLPELHVRQFLATAAEHGRLDAFLRVAGDGMLDSAMRGIETLDDALAAGQVIDAATSASARAKLRSVVETEVQPDRVFYGLLAAKLGFGDFVEYFDADRQLTTARLFDSNGSCIQRHVFHADDDGVESFDSFRGYYESDPAWRWEDHGSYVHVVSGAVEIYANKPLHDSQSEISRVLAERGATVSVFVHRGHSYHVERSLTYLTSSARLVFMGSCRGLGVTTEVIAAAPRAQVIVTRGIGTQSINDPLLKALNDQLRKGATTINWSDFWKLQEARFGRSPVFEDYIPPHRNGSAQLAAAYYAWLGAR